MEELFDESYLAYSAEDMMFLATESKRLNAGNGLELYLQQEGFKQVEMNLYAHENPKQLIELIPGVKEKKYINLLEENDRGHYIQFLQNRLLEHGKVIPNGHLFTFLSAVRYARHLEKTNRSKIQPKLKVSRKRKGKSL